MFSAFGVIFFCFNQVLDGKTSCCCSLFNLLNYKKNISSYTLCKKKHIFCSIFAAFYTIYTVLAGFATAKVFIFLNVYAVFINGLRKKLCFPSPLPSPKGFFLSPGPSPKGEGRSLPGGSGVTTFYFSVFEFLMFL